MADFYELQKQRFNQWLQSAKDAGSSSILDFGDDAVSVGLKSNYFIMDGEEVTKEHFILNSGMEHLILDRSMVVCTRCGRKANPARYKELCGSDWSGDSCQGIFF